ncbi:MULTISPECIES: NAD(P)/FAD-dependent oxidoreductase [Streptomyces]|uniref:Phytoene dehydrogenase-like protein n=2 Tax=Streptomyces TaxID=1883 RepID=A0ABT9LCC5_STRGD|nr:MULTISPECIES: NAD(P)/FAD-dependent oxidoreductase [Streptomyces]MDP9681374.1 phytoene dehydrogenase-like protein [Streptomyces griseoviridis]GGS75064.1 oxidoreductase [Streptomyces griseoviridis]GGU37539.1 oxidoreductase [Streptomyces daghestanicus]GHI34625.1 oxidoreductase [Streptomyces daghestanicus]
MLEPAYQADVVVVGAGVAGLAAAHRLISQGVSAVVLEAAPVTGGRMATEKVDGFRLDRIGQLLSTACPELRLTPGLDGLALRPFASGALVHSEGLHHRVTAPLGAGGARGALHAVRALTSAPRSAQSDPVARRHGVITGWPGAMPWPLPRAAARASVTRRGRAGAPPVLGGAVDQARLSAALTRLATTPAERLLARPELPARQALAVRGLPARTVDGVLRPLLAALLADPDLSTSSRAADLALRMFASGRLCLPEGGAETLPALLAKSLPPGTVRTGVRVTAVATNAVTTAQHGVLRCRAVLLATDARAAAELLPGLRVPEFHPVTVVHHAADEPPATGAALLLDADRDGPVAHTAVVSEVDPTRAPAGRTLVSSTVLGPPPPDADAAVRRHLARLYGTSTARWETLAVHHTPEAVPAMRPPHDPRRPVRLLAGLYVCGDHRDTGTVQGALRSGRRVAAAVLADLGARGPMHSAGPPAPARAA